MNEVLKLDPSKWWIHQILDKGVTCREFTVIPPPGKMQLVRQSIYSWNKKNPRKAVKMSRKGDGLLISMPTNGRISSKPSKPQQSKSNGVEEVLLTNAMHGMMLFSENLRQLSELNKEYIPIHKMSSTLCGIMREVNA